MKSRVVILIIIFMTILLSSCSTEMNNSPDPQAGSSDICKEPPTSFTWNKKTYNLKTIGDRELEPGMKWGYLICSKEQIIVQKEGPNATFNLYTYGNSIDELLYFGEWGRALYTSK
ncbi:hypothetical protein E0485_05645 [Paenibacillus albiflavus]|uniref:Lipoprotein n=1 Tax=Paenibacillus albiflavus TaxID=2545760 RepID=A0A4R4EIW9_9BACL|nr:hypothetical protein [Paenibacillus albiflavus]TCZ79343.1 hypothetical protein E0485_05645 [Paenibacillus albiflavus]